MRALSVVLLSLVSFSSGFSQQGKARPLIGVALQGGGAKGLAHIGVLRWFEEHHIPIDFVAGTSMGALVGGLYATGYTPTEIESIVQKVDWNEVMSGQTPYPDLAFRRKEDFRAYPNGMELGLRKGLQPPGGLNSGQAVRVIIDRYVLPYSRVDSFDQLPTPFRCVATDLVSGKPIVFERGSLPNALRATMSIPGVFSPVKDEGRILADGGLLNNLPTDVVKQMGADIVIGVHLTTGPVVAENVSSLFQVAGESTSVMINANELRGMERADILITIDVAGYSTLDFSRVDKIVPKGVEAAEARSGVLAGLRLSDADWNSYLARRETRLVKATPSPAFVEVRGPNPHLSKGIERELSDFTDKPIDVSALEDKISQQIGLGRLTSLSYSLIERDGKTGLLVTPEEKDYAPPWVKPGFGLDGSDPNNVQFTLGSRITFLDVGGYRSEIRTDFSIGATYSFAAEYYHPFTATSRWFIAPQINVSRSSLNLYLKDTFLAEYKLNQASGGVDVGYSIDRFSEIRAGYQLGYSDISRWIGSPLLPSVSGRTGTARVRYAMDRLDNPIVPRQGFAMTANGGWTDARPGVTRAYPVAEMGIQAFRRLNQPASIFFTAAGGTTFGAVKSGVPAFFLGGPGRLSAYGANEFLTNQYFYGRAGYLHRLWDIPAFLGNAFYLTTFYEVGKPYGRLNGSQLPNDGVVGIIASTVLGPVLVGGSVGEGGHHKWFFELGRVF